LHGSKNEEEDEEDGYNHKVGVDRPQTSLYFSRKPEKMNNPIRLDAIEAVVKVMDRMGCDGQSSVPFVVVNSAKHGTS
jgi:hypothetical protein